MYQLSGENCDRCECWSDQHCCICNHAAGALWSVVKFCKCVTILKNTVNNNRNVLILYSSPLDCFLCGYHIENRLV